jgi:hypothetical protein
VGNSFGNLHVRAGPDGAAATQARVLAAVDAWMAEQGYTPTDGPPFARAVLVGGTPDGDWISVYDSEHDAYGSDDLPPMGAQLSATIGTPVVGCLCFDSDIATYWLFLDGDEVAGAVDRPEYIEELSGETVGPMDDAAWASVLRDEATATAFWNALRGDGGDDDVFAEDRVGKALAVLGMDGHRATLGYRYAEQEGVAASMERRWYTAGPVAPGMMTGQLGADVVSGPDPELAAMGIIIMGTDGLSARVGDVDLSLSMASYGPPLEGVVILLGGDAIRDGLLEPSTVMALSLASAMGGPASIPAPTPFQRGEQATWFAELPSLRLGVDATAAPEHGRSQQWMLQMANASASLRITARALRPGQGTLQVAAVSSEEARVAGDHLEVRPWEVRVIVR